MKLRLRKRKGEVSLENVSLSAAEEAVPSATERLELEEAVLTLPDQLRTTFVLREVEGYSHDEIGNMLGIGAGASRVRLHRARKQLRNSLGQYR